MKILYDTRPFYTERLQKLALPIQRSFEIPLPHGSRAQVQLLLPPSWREELRDAAFPVVVEVYVPIIFYEKISLFFTDHKIYNYALIYNSRLSVFRNSRD